MKKQKINHWLLGFLSVLILMMVAQFIPQYIPMTASTKKIIRPYREVALLPIMTFSTYQFRTGTYCFLAKHTPLDYNRCLRPDVPPHHFAMPDGPPNWYEKGMFWLSVFLTIAMYAAAFKICIILKNKYYDTKN